MLTFLLILIILAAIILVLFILAQNPKGGGLSATFGGSSQIIGARQTADFLEKATWYLAIAIVVITLLTNFFIPRTSSEGQQESVMQEQIDNMPNPLPPSTQGEQNQ